MLIAVGVAGIVIAAGIVVLVLDRSPRQSSPAGAVVAAPAVATLAAPARMAERTAIAVLPFKNLSGDGQDFFSDGVTEDIINALGRYSNLLVAAKSASFQFKGRNVSPGMSRTVLKFARQTSLVEQAMRPWPAVQGEGCSRVWRGGRPGRCAGSVIACGP
jgi:hypothetical protein